MTGRAPRVTMTGRAPRVTMIGRAPRVLALTVGFGLGGAERLLLLVAPRLRALGFDVRVGALKGDGPLRGDLERAGVPCVTFGARHRGDLGALLRLGRSLRRERIDVLHAHLFYANVAARIVGRLAGVPVVLTSHHDTDVWMGPHHRLLERLTAPLSDRVLACSEAVRRYALERHRLSPGRVLTLRNAIDAGAVPSGPDARERARAVLGAGPHDRVAGTLGRLHEPKKGLRVFLAAAARVAAEDPRARFVLVGDGPARPELERLAAALGIADRVRFLGERADAAAILPGFDVLVQPSLWEGFGLSVLEAMAAGVPVVATRVGGLPEVVRDGLDGVLVPPSDTPRLAAAITALLADGGRAACLGSSGRLRAREEFHVDRLVAETASLYRALLAEPGLKPAPGAAGVGRAA